MMNRKSHLRTNISREGWEGSRLKNESAKHRNEVEPWKARPFAPAVAGANGHALLFKIKRNPVCFCCMKSTYFWSDGNDPTSFYDSPDRFPTAYNHQMVLLQGMNGID